MGTKQIGTIRSDFTHSKHSLNCVVAAITHTGAIITVGYRLVI